MSSQKYPSLLGRDDPITVSVQNEGSFFLSNLWKLCQL